MGYGDIYPDAEALAGRQPKDVQAVVKPLFKALLSKSNDELYILKAHADVCALSDLIDCDGVPSQVVKPFVESALDLKKYSEAAYRAWTGLTVALGSLVISLLSLVFAVFAFIRKNEEPTPRGPARAGDLGENDEARAA